MRSHGRHRSPSTTITSTKHEIGHIARCTLAGTFTHLQHLTNYHSCIYALIGATKIAPIIPEQTIYQILKCCTLTTDGNLTRPHGRQCSPSTTLTSTKHEIGHTAVHPICQNENCNLHPLGKHKPQPQKSLHPLRKRDPQQANGENPPGNTATCIRSGDTSPSRKKAYIRSGSWMPSRPIAERRVRARVSMSSKR